MRERPILFSTQMVQAILAGQKTMTRRIVKVPVQKMVYQGTTEYEQKYGHFTFIDEHTLPVASLDQLFCTSCPYGKPGDILWVRETWKSVGFNDDVIPQLHIQYKDGVARWVDVDSNVKLKAQNKWKPSIHMIKKAARIWLRVKSVRVERLQQITNEDAISEGVNRSEKKGYFLNYEKQRSGVTQFVYEAGLTPNKSFMTLWNVIHSKESWNANPWVWVIEFEVLSITGKPSNV